MSQGEKFAAGKTGEQGAIKIAAVADIHFRGNSRDRLRPLVSRVNEEAHALVLAGDLTDRGSPAEARALVEELQLVHVPIVAVLGNHDFEEGKADELRRVLHEAGIVVLDGDTYDLHGQVGFAGAKGFAGGYENHALQPWGETVLKEFVYEAVREGLKLERALATLETRIKVVITHYAPIRETIDGEPPEVIPFLGSSRLVDPIDEYGATIVLHGHAHHGVLHGKTPRGVPVYNVSLPVLRHVAPDACCLLITVPPSGTGLAV
ncbi:MAG TPA: metallophosphoesterase, partial [Chloroflexota bacterium]